MTTMGGDDVWQDPGIEIEIDLTGHSHVDLVLERLSGLNDRTLPEHAVVFDDVHQRLRGVLSSEQGPQSVQAGRGADR